MKRFTFSRCSYSHCISAAIVAFLLLLFINNASSFAPRSMPFSRNSILCKAHSHFSTESSVASNVNEQEKQKLAILRNMSTKALKEELKRLQVSTSDVFEKEQLVQRLYQAQERQRNGSNPSSNGNNSNNNKSKIELPLNWIPLDPYVKLNNQLQITPTAQLYPAIRVAVHGYNRQSSNTNVLLSLLLDTACTGMILKPQVLQKYNNLPRLSTPVMMTSAGGVQAQTGLTQLSIKLLPSDSTKQENNDKNLVFGPMPAAVQELGPIPQILDGIIGLQFLNQFEAMEMEMYREAKTDGRYSSNASDENRRTSKLILHKVRPTAATIIDNDDSSLKLVTQSDLQMTRNFGLFSVPVYFGNQGPVNMLVDTGASSTFLNWQGVKQLGIDRYNSRVISPLPANTGALGSDAKALTLTHQLFVSSSVTLGKQERPQTGTGGNTSSGLQLLHRTPIAIGNIPVLEGLPGIGGILGLDIFQQASKIVFYSKPPYRLELYQ